MKANKLLLVLALFGACAIGAKAQAGDGFPVGPLDVPDYPIRPLVAAKVADPHFPLQIQFANSHWKYSGNHEYKGSGVFNLVGAADQDFAYRYSCGYSFRTRRQIYQARWVTPGKKLEILMAKPGSSHTTTCRLSTHG